MSRFITVCTVAFIFSLALQARQARLHPLEKVPDGEVELVRGEKGLVNTFKSVIGTVRDAHPKAHGCLKARVIVNNDLHADLQGNPIYQPGAIYEEAYIRLSKGDNRPDNTRGGHGMALKVLLPKKLQKKVLSLRGEKIFRDPTLYFGFDILTINVVKEFFVDTAADYPVFLAATQKMEGALKTGKTPAEAWEIFRSIYVNPKEGKQREREEKLLKQLKVHETRNPLQEDYFSWAAWSYQTGENKVTAVKYRLSPCDPPKGKYAFPDGVSEKDDNFLKKVVIHEVKQRVHHYCLAAQVWKNEMKKEGSSVEHSAIPWSEKISPYRPLARVVIPKSKPGREILADNFCEMLAYNPRRAPEGNQGIGSVNRARGEIYAATHTKKALNRDERPIKIKRLRRR